MSVAIAFASVGRAAPALSTLPATWKDYNSRQIADSAAAALLSMLNADVIYVTVPGLRGEPVADVMRTSQAVSRGAHSIVALWPGTADSRSPPRKNPNG